MDEQERARLENLTADDLKVPDYAVLTFAVCTVSDDGCGWGGWLLEGVFEISSEKNGLMRNGDHGLSTADKQICPRCGETLFRTDSAQVFDLGGPACLLLPLG